MRYNFLTNDLIKKRLIDNEAFCKGATINKSDSVRRRMIGSDYAFEFYPRKKYLQPQPESVTPNVLIFTEQEMNALFLKDIRKEKLNRINKLCFQEE